MDVVQLRHDTPGRAYYRRRLAEGKTTMEPLRGRAASRWDAHAGQGLVR